MATTITIVSDGGSVFIDSACEATEDVTVVEVLGIIELAKAILVRDAGE